MRKAMAILFCVVQAEAWGFTGAAQVPYLIRLVTENVKRYHQLREVIKQAEEGTFI